MALLLEVGEQDGFGGGGGLFVSEIALIGLDFGLVGHIDAGLVAVIENGRFGLF